MASLAEPLAAISPALSRQAEILARPLTQARRMADAIRALAIDAVEAANSGHPGCRWAWPMSPPCCGPDSSNSTPPIRAGRTATASCSRPGTARCCSMRCCI